MNQERLIRANDQLRHLKSIGMLSRRSPTAKQRAEPSSLRKSVTAFCYECVGGDGEVNAKKHVRGCTATQCPLYRVRPWQAERKLNENSK